MSLFEDIQKQMNNIQQKFSIPLITRIFIPAYAEQDCDEKTVHSKKNNFIAIGLADGAVGLTYIRYLMKDQFEALQKHQSGLIGKNPLDLVAGFGSDSVIDHMLGLGAVNAISQSFLSQKQIPLDFTTDSLGELNVQPADHIGMVGFFTPLIPQIRGAGARLTILEKRKDLIQEHPKWKVTLDPQEFATCNKILCTASTLVNRSIEDVLSYCQNCEFFTLVGPTAGLLPDELFKRGITVIAGSHVHNADLCFDCLEAERDWAPAVKKYCIQKSRYKGYLSY
jgi:uncharacterized protein (DUF4213/DUF364 family)